MSSAADTYDQTDSYYAQMIMPKTGTAVWQPSRAGFIKQFKIYMDNQVLGVYEKIDVKKKTRHFKL